MSDPTTLLAPTDSRSYGHVYWPNGWRKQGDDASGDVLAFETGHYGLTFDVRDLTKVRFGAFIDDGDGDVSYLEALDDDAKGGRMDDDRLPERRLVMEVQADGKTYSAVACLAGTANHRGKARLWEAGRLVQHYELLGVTFESADGDDLGGCECDLDVIAWPRHFALTLNVSPGKGRSWEDGANVRMDLGDWSVNRAFLGRWDGKDRRGVTLRCDVVSTGDIGEGSSAFPLDDIGIEMNAWRIGANPVPYEEIFGCHVCRVDNPPRYFSTGYTDIRHSDRFDITIRNDTDEDVFVPFLLHLTDAANPTGMVAVVSHKNTVPTGVPIQTSKNWHYPPLKKLLRAYSLLPAGPGTTEYIIFVHYGFYGNLPSASHANLSLVGWNDNANGRWEQLSIGCWGETYCIDAEFSATNHNMITDVRGLMLRNGADGGKWGWTNAGWGGDWLKFGDKRGRDVYTRSMKAAYILVSLDFLLMN